MEKLSFFKQYIAKPRNVGAILPSSKYLASKMIENIDFDTAKNIIEYGAGTGIFTAELLRAKNPDTKILAFENNHMFHEILKNKFKDVENLYIIDDSAENIGLHLENHHIEYADYIVSGLPFTSLPDNVSRNILAQTENYLKPGGKFITFQYTLLKKEFIGQYFDKIDIKVELRNLPPAYVLCCNHEEINECIC